jgi:hypothetical protein
LAYNFNNGDTPSAAPPDPLAPDAETPDAAEGTPPEPTPSEALLRFRACRWMQPADNGNPAFCTHREVKPYAGSSTFDPDAWCPDCSHYKLKRIPKKRSPDDYQY